MISGTLIERAQQVREHAYCPHSDYPVGAALVDDQGQIFVGVNVENESFGATICAERSAIVAMVASGGRRITGLAVVTRNGGSPCGMCLQVIHEFAGADLPIWLVNGAGVVREHRFSDFFPQPFKLSEQGDASKASPFREE